MFSEAIFIFYGLMGGLAIVIIYFLIASVFWHQEGADQFAGKPVHTELANQLGELRLPKKKMQEAVDRMAEVVQREVAKETQKVQAETRKILTEKEIKLKEVTRKYETVEQNYQILGKQKTQTESVVRSIAGGVIVLDDNGKVVFLNPDAEKILGHKAKDLLGKQMNQMQGEHMISMVNEEGVEEKTGNKNSGKQDMKEHTAVIETVGGQTRGVISLMPNRTSETRVEEYKNEFLSNITHELRSPLVCIQKSMSSILGKVSGEEKEYVDIAIRNAARLEKLVNEILDLSKLESGKVYLRYEILTLKALIEEVVGNFRVWAQDKNLELKIEMPEDASVFEADRDKLGQVLTNFIANAVKFTPRGGKITVIGKFTVGIQDKTGVVEVGVRDTGPGLSEEDRVKVFKKFAFINTKPTEGEPSTGLGLSISKEIVELHKGKIWVESQAGHGSYFAFSVPTQKPA